MAWFIGLSFNRDSYNRDSGRCGSYFQAQFTHHQPACDVLLSNPVEPGCISASF
jgi:hypothetical protein